MTMATHFPFLRLLVFFCSLLPYAIYGQFCEEVWSNAATGNATGHTMALDATGNPIVLHTNDNGSIGLTKLAAADGAELWHQSFCAPAPSNCSAYIPNAIVVDAAGNSYIAGYEHNFGSTTFGIGVWIRKYSSAGSLIWAEYRTQNLGQVQRFFTTNTLKPYVWMRLDATGHLLVATSFTLEKFDLNGNLSWSSSIVGNGRTMALKVGTDNSVWVLGGGSAGTYLSKIDANGSLLWQYTNTSSYFNPADLELNATNQAFVLALSGVGADYTVLAISPSGTFQSAAVFPVASAQVPRNLALDPAGNFVMTGITQQTTGLPYVDWLTIKGNTAGNILWMDIYSENPDNDEFPSFYEGALAIDAAGDVLVTGYGGPLYLNGNFSIASSVTLRYNGSTGERTCTWLDQSGMGTGLEVIPYNGAYYLAGYGERQVKKYSSQPQSGVNISLKAFLKGPYDSPAFMRRMTTSLNSFLPNTQPYDASPWWYDGSESTNQIPATAVDWVLLEIRSSTDAASTFYRAAGLLHEDGNVTAANGAALRFEPPANGSGSFYFVLKHRNHLSIMNGTPIGPGSGGNYTVDLSSYGAYGGFNAGVVVVSNLLAMLSGDANGDGDINALDRNLYITSQLGATNGYYPGDLDLDGDVDNIDLITFWLAYNGRFTTVPN